MGVAEVIGKLESIASVLVDVLGRQSWFAAIVFVIVAAVSVITRHRFPRLQYGLWGLVLLRLVLPTELASSWSARTILERTTPPSVFLPAAFEPSMEQVNDSPGDETRPPWSTVTILLWALGVASSGALIVRKRRSCRRLVERAHVVDIETHLATAERWRALFGIRHPVALVTLDEPLSPFTLGTCRPVIFLPSSFLTQSDPALVEAAIAHEMAHIRRRDDLRLLFQNLVQVLYFFHPLVWLCARRMGEERERICDEMVLVRGALSPRDYGRSLLEAFRLGWESPHSAATFGNHKRRISMRIQRILNGSAVRERGRAVPFVALVVLGSFLLPMARISQSAVVRFEAQPPRTVEMANPLPEGRVTSRFGERKNPFSGKVEHHAGIDIAAPRGANVLASIDGVVEIAETEYPGRPEFGTVVVIDHGRGVKTFYAHLESLAVETGRRVAGGDTIGTVGSSGLSRGSHLHFEIWKDERPVDPALLLGNQ